MAKQKTTPSANSDDKSKKDQGSRKKKVEPNGGNIPLERFPLHVMGSALNSLRFAEHSSGKFVISNRCAFKTIDQRRAGRDHLEKKFNQVLESYVNVVSEFRSGKEPVRRLFCVEGDLDEIAAKALELGEDTIVERYLPRTPAINIPPYIRALQQLHGTVQQKPGVGAGIEFRLISAEKPLVGADVTMYLQSKVEKDTVTSAEAISNHAGAVNFNYNPNIWTPINLLVEPAGGAWNVVETIPANGSVIKLPPLTLSGPVNWWHELVGATKWDPQAGEGIRVGVVDTGVGPHPFLSHVEGIGAFVDGSFIQGAEATLDYKNHGTHVCGIIGARPVDSKGYGGIAPGVELFGARVFNGPIANQGDIANAIEYLSLENQCDLINLSLGGEFSQIEADALGVALENGTLCICAAGNGYGQNVMFPAASGASVAVSALGLEGTYPAGTISAANVPTQQHVDKFAGQGLYLAAFSNLGTSISVTAPGNAIVSTVPQTEHYPAPYLPMDGTSMASPIVTGALAVLLSKNDNYKKMDRNAFKAQYAMDSLVDSAIPLRLKKIYQGAGIAREMGQWPV